MAWRLFSVSQAQDNRPHITREADLFAPSPDYGPWRNSIPLRAVSVKGRLAAVWRKMRTFGYKLSARHACSHHLCYLCLVGPCCPSRQGRQSHFRIQHSIRKRKREIHIERLRLVTGITVLAVACMLPLFLLNVGDAFRFSFSGILVAICIASVILSNTWAKK